MKMEFKIKTNNIDQIKAASEQAVRIGLEMCGLQAEGYAIDICPVGATGRLRGSITHGVIQEELTAFIGTNVKYAAYVEFGTSRMKPQPYLKPAVNNHQQEYKDIFQYCLENA